MPRTRYSDRYLNNEVVVFKVCPHPPSKVVLEGILSALAMRRNKNLGMDKEHKPDRNWLIIAIATLDAQHEIFGKSYKPQVRQGPGAGPGLMVNNADDFFTDLPILSSVRDLKVKSISCLSKEERLASKLAKEKAKIEKAKERMQSLQAQALGA